MAKQILTSFDLLSLPSLTTPKTGSVGFGAKSDGLYQKIGTVESKLSTTAELLDRVKTAVPANAKFTDTTYGVATTSANGLMSSADKSKLNGIEAGANKYVHPSSHPISFITGLQGALDSKATQSDISTAINELEIGGRNLFNRSKLVVGYPQGASVIPSIPINNDYGFQITGTAGTTNTRIRIPDVISETGWWTVSCEVQGNWSNLPFSVNIAGMPKKNFTTGLATEWKRIEITSNVTGGENYVEFADIGYIVFKVRRLKIEKGNKATDWTPPPEDQVTINTAQTITGAKTFSTLLTASAGVNTPKVDFRNGFTIEPSGTELVFKYNGVIKQRMLSDGTILAVGGITALSTE